MKKSNRSITVVVHVNESSTQPNRGIRNRKHRRNNNNNNKVQHRTKQKQIGPGREPRKELQVPGGLFDVCFHLGGLLAGDS